MVKYSPKVWPDKLKGGGMKDRDLPEQQIEYWRMICFVMYMDV